MKVWLTGKEESGILQSSNFLYRGLSSHFILQASLVNQFFTIKKGGREERKHRMEEN